MNKALMISIRPEHALNILNGKKTLELRTWIPKDYVGWVYVVITKKKPYITKQSNTQFTLRDTDSFTNVINSKVAFRFWFDDYETYDFDNHGVNLYTDVEEYNVMYDDLERLYLDYREIENYGNGKTLYAWHIKQLEIFDKPKSLSEFNLTKAPQSKQYVFVEDN